MRLTVGPLPPAVYWRRRAVVLGALLAVVVLFYAACSGSDPDRKQGAKPSPSASAPGGGSPDPSGSALPTDEPTGDVGGGVDGGADGGDDGTGVGDGTGDGTSQVDGEDEGNPEPAPQAPAGAGPCTDEEMDIRPVPAKTTVSQRTPIDIRLLIKNVSDRSCRRDVGADLQELRIVQGAQTIWSSDHCGPARGSDVRTFGPGATREYMVTWNGESSSKCSAGVPDGGPPPAGEYQLLARLGTKHSAPVTLTLRAA